MLVVDACAIADLLLLRPAAAAIERHIAAYGHAMHAPHLLDIEVLSALRRVVASGEASRERAGEAIADLRDLRLERSPHDVLTARIWALRENFSAYDAAYLALAEQLTERGAPLLTTDARFARAARAHGTVDVLVA